MSYSRFVADFVNRLLSDESVPLNQVLSYYLKDGSIEVQEEHPDGTVDYMVSYPKSDAKGHLITVKPDGTFFATTYFTQREGGDTTHPLRTPLEVSRFIVKHTQGGEGYVFNPDGSPETRRRLDY